MLEEDACDALVRLERPGACDIAQRDDAAEEEIVTSVLHDELSKGRQCRAVSPEDDDLSGGVLARRSSAAIHVRPCARRCFGALFGEPARTPAPRVVRSAILVRSSSER